MHEIMDKLESVRSVDLIEGEDQSERGAFSYAKMRDADLDSDILHQYLVKTMVEIVERVGGFLHSGAGFGVIIDHENVSGNNVRLIGIALPNSTEDT